MYLFISHNTKVAFLVDLIYIVLGDHRSAGVFMKLPIQFLMVSPTICHHSTPSTLCRPRCCTTDITRHKLHRIRVRGLLPLQHPVQRRLISHPLTSESPVSLQSHTVASRKQQSPTYSQMDLAWYVAMTSVSVAPSRSVCRSSRRLSWPCFGILSRVRSLWDARHSRTR